MVVSKTTTRLRAEKPGGTERSLLTKPGDAKQRETRKEESVRQEDKSTISRYVSRGAPPSVFSIDYRSNQSGTIHPQPKTVDYVDDDMAPIILMDHHQTHHLQPSWAGDGRQQQTRTGGAGGGMGVYAPQQQWTGAGGGGQMHIMDDGVFAASAHHHSGMNSRSSLMPRSGGAGGALQPAPIMGGSRDLLGEGTFMGRGYSIKRCQGFVRCDMDIDAEVVGWVIGKNGEFLFCIRR